MEVQPTQLSQTIQQYLQIEDELQTLAKQQKELRDRKQQLQTIITDTMKTKGLENRTLKMGNRQISLVSKKQYSGITFGYLDKTLSELIPDDDQKTYVLQYLREKRTVHEVQDIRIRTV